MRKRISNRLMAFLGIIFLLGAFYVYAAIRELTYAGEPEQIEYIQSKVAEYARTIDPTQQPEIDAYYFGGAMHYISEFTLVDPAEGETVEYMCSWPADVPDANLDSICSGRIVNLEHE